MAGPDRGGVLAQRAADLLADGAPRTMAAITEALGLPPPTDEYEQEDLEFVFGLDDDRYAYRVEADDYVDLRALLAGRTFTCEPASREGDPIRVGVDPDLAFLLLPVLRAERIPVCGGWDARWDEDEVPFAIVWMSAEPLLAAAAGGTPGFRWEDGELAIVSVAVDQAESLRVSAAIRRVFERQGTECAELVDLLIELVLEDDAAFRTPVPPVGSLLASAELSRRGDYVGPAGVPWKTPIERAEADRDALNTSAYGFDECCHRAFHALTRGFLEFSAGREPEPEHLADAADHGVVAEAFLAAEITGPFGDGLVETLLPFAALLPQGGPGAQYLRFAAHDLRGETAEAKRHLGYALAADPDFPPALAEAATLAEERGRAAEAAEHLRRLGVPADDPQLRRVQDALRWGRSATGRNAPCPCGSGRKYKACCLGRELPPLAERVDWLFAKAVAFANRPAERGLLIELAESLTRGPGAAGLLDALSEPLVTDVALFEEGQLERYLAVRGALLPEDERALAAAWLHRPRSLLEITGITASGELELRDTRDGQRWVVPAGRAGSAARPGEFLLARVCAVGDTQRFVGAILSIPLRVRGSLLDLIAAEPDAWNWLDWLAAATAPPTLANTEGEALVFCEADYHVDDPGGAARALGAGFEEADDGGSDRVFHDILDPEGDRWVRGTVRLDGNRLRIEANSEARLGRLEARIAALVPDAQLLDIRRTGVQEVVAQASAGEASTPGPQPPPGAEDLVAEYLADTTAAGSTWTSPRSEVEPAQGRRRPHPP